MWEVENPSPVCGARGVDYRAVNSIFYFYQILLITTYHILLFINKNVYFIIREGEIIAQTIYLKEKVKKECIVKHKNITIEFTKLSKKQSYI